MIITVRFSPCLGMYFDQQYEVTTEQHVQLMKLNFTYHKHTCLHTLLALVKQHKIDCSDILQNISCSYCKYNLRELRYINCVEAENIRLTSCSFPLEMLIFISKEEEKLASYAVKINEIIKNEINQETKTVKCSDLRQNGYAMIQGHPCKIVHITTSKD